MAKCATAGGTSPHDLGGTSPQNEGYFRILDWFGAFACSSSTPRTLPAHPPIDNPT